MHSLLDVKELITYFSGCKAKCNVYISPPLPAMCSGVAAAAVAAGKDFAAAVAMFFSWHIIRQSCFLFLGVFLMHSETSALAPWPVF